MLRANTDIRAAIQEAGLYHWQVAQKLKISPSTLVNWLRIELTADRKAMILEAIQNLAKDGVRNAG